MVLRREVVALQTDAAKTNSPRRFVTASGSKTPGLNLDRSSVLNIWDVTMGPATGCSCGSSTIPCSKTVGLELAGIKRLEHDCGPRHRPPSRRGPRHPPPSRRADGTDQDTHPRRGVLAEGPTDRDHTLRCDRGIHLRDFTALRLRHPQSSPRAAGRHNLLGAARNIFDK
jgi:hypothetical protein